MNIPEKLLKLKTAEQILFGELEMKNPFKVGDKVRLRGFAEIGGESSDVEGRKGFITKASENRGTLTVQCIGDEWEVHVYPSQCRRLVKKKRMEIWVHLDCETKTQTESGVVSSFYNKSIPFPGATKFREVKE